MSSFNNQPAAEIHPASAPDYLPIPQMRDLQLGRLRATVRRAYERVELYRQRMDQGNVSPEDIRTLSDLARFPFTEKADLRDNYPCGLFASPLEEVVRLHASSGTTGKPIVVAYTQQDVGVWTDAMARTLTACGLGRGDIIQNAYGYGLFTGGLGAHYGAEALGATVIPISGGNTERQIMVMKDFKVTAICCTPTYFLHLLDRAAQMGVDVRELPLRVGVFGAEPWTDSMRRHIEAASRINAYDIYGLTEITGPGVASECRRQAGLHVFEDHFYPEIVNPDSGELVPEGEEGELVVTTLSKQAMPMLRYRTRDITAFVPGACACGRTLRRIRRISRRSDDMFIIRGVNVYPSQVETALLAVEGMLPHYQIILTREEGLDQMEVQVEVTPPVSSDRVGALENLHNKLAQSLHQTLGLRVKVRLVGPQTIKRSEGKAQRLIDRRNADR
jgi:phenylacetate-CoA ligase